MKRRPIENYGLYEMCREHDSCGIGAVVHISGRRSHEIIERGRTVLNNLLHRGATGGDETTGDGAGILFQIPHEYFRIEGERVALRFPEPGTYGVAMVFSPRERLLRQSCNSILEEAVRHYGMRIVGWRDVPTDNRTLGELARESEPAIGQLIIDGAGLRDGALECRLYMARKRAERLIRECHGNRAADFYICSMSCRTIVYKGMFMAPQLFSYYPDLSNERVVSCMAVVHQRYSTNTFPSWRLAQPFRMIAHNGEISTLSGNVNRMRSRETSMQSPVLGDDLTDLFPIVEPGSSDSASFDNALELLVRAGRSLPHTIMMMIPEAFGTAYHISTDKRAFYEFHASFMEPWDGPAAMVFADGRLLGGTLDRNGLRPARYIITTDDILILASEVGTNDFPPERIRKKGHLRPGHMLLVDTEEGRIIGSNEVKSKIARSKPYRRFLAQHQIELRGLFNGTRVKPVDPKILIQRLRTFGYTVEDLRMILAPMAKNGQEPVGSMGTDTPLAVLSDRPKLLYNYFKQIFAQVTNPPIDPLREGLVMSLMSYMGREGNLLDDSPEHCHQLRLPHPILTNQDVSRLKSVERDDFRVVTIPTFFLADSKDPGGSLRRSLERLVDDAGSAIREGASLIILSDRDISPTRVPIPALLAVGAVHHGLLERRLRCNAGLMIESGEPREVMHFCLLLGCGASAVNPYLAFESLPELTRRGYLPDDMTSEELVDNYILALKKGLLKTMSKMGISTLRSYRGAQLFEAVGLNREVVDQCFRGVASRIGGIGFDVIATEVLRRHEAGLKEPVPGSLDLKHGGEYHFRLQGEEHHWNPTTVARLHHAVRQNDPDAYADFARAANDQSFKLCTLRGLFQFKPGEPVPLEEVEPAGEIVKRFNTGAMSHGSISKEAHETLAVAMNRLGGKSNTGEGGEDPRRYVPKKNGDSANSAIKQVASARFGVTADYLAHARELQIKMAQGAKPGEGGQLPGHKVTGEIARLRYSTPGVTLISPPPHHDIYSIEDLAQLIYDLKCANPGVKVSVKLVSEVGVGTVAAGVAKANADEVLVSGYDGGTGASPLSSIKHAGIPWELGLAETQQTLILNGMRDRIRVQVDGQLKTGRDVVIAAMLGAERFGFGTAALVTLGCCLMRKCHLGTCPVGIATQDPKLRGLFSGRPEHLERYFIFVAEEIRRLMAQLGFRKFDEMVGRVERLEYRPALDHWKAGGLDLSAIFKIPVPANGHPRYCVHSQQDRLASHLDWEILEIASKAIKNGEKVSIDMQVRNVNRTVGAILSNRVIREKGPEGLPDGTIDITLRGSAGQSFGAFLVPGINLRLVGDANDYLGKGLSGGRIVVQTPAGSPFEAHDNVIAGNTLLYGATAGEAFINGLVGERFAVRNSGASAVVEGVGDHGCEYMTKGIVVVLGNTGRNFAAGMSGGVAYVFDEHQLFDTLCNLDMVDLETVWRQEDQQQLHDLVLRHHHWTGSSRAAHILEKWPDMVGRFVKVIPIDYRKALKRLREREERSGEMTPATEEVFGG